MPDIPLDLVAACEQAYAEANQRLDLVLEAVLQTIDLRVKEYGIVDDSIHYVAMRDWIMSRITMDGSMITATVLSAALFKLARAPRAADPLEQMMDSTKDKGGEQK